ncbi:hypothetical protein V5O48_012181, partial [Marasmius crinis-equi]
MGNDKHDKSVDVTEIALHEVNAGATAELRFSSDDLGPTTVVRGPLEDKLEKDEWEDDPDNARNWSSVKKWTAVSIVSLYTFLPPLSSSMMAPGLPEMAQKYSITSPTIVSLTLSIFLLSFAIGPLFCAPLSEMYGRTWVLHFGALFMMAFNFGCAFSPSAGSFIGFRFLSGFAGSAPLAVGGGSIADLFAEKDRAAAMSIYVLGPLIGPVVGPVAGGFIAETIGIKYVFIIVAGLASAIGIPLLRETYAPIIRARRAKRRGDPEERREAENTLATKSWQYLWINLTRPVILLSTSFLCFILSLYMA